jgi:rsbT co-antagonist protein RsbR
MSQMLHAVLDALNVQIWTAKASGELDFVNLFTAAYFGRTREQLLGEGWTNVLHASDLDRTIEHWTRSLQTGDPYDVDFRLLRAEDRIYRWHHASARRVAGADGLMWIGSNVDVDAERRAEEVQKSPYPIGRSGR